MFLRSEKYITEQREIWQHADRQDRAGYFWYEKRSQDSQLSNVVIFKEIQTDLWLFSVWLVTDHCIVTREPIFFSYLRKAQNDHE